ncbi:acyl-CoA dehydrogenase family protein, partial [Saccharomonospora iraqiensis]|uniref:acyl-CoA dehydrogenase family protein n=1 Tax=Saccharomonospora iraqiensis TaxID=52698 RepID=UPI00047B948C
MSAPDLLYSDVETDLRASVADMLADHCEPSALLARVESDEPYDPALWRTLAGELGLAGLHVPEAFGGQGASTRETAVVLEELGRSAAPVPYLGSAVLATSVLLAADPADGGPVADLLRGLASG